MPLRVRILALLAGGVAINYLDRALLGISVPSLQQGLHLSPAALGLLLSAFSWTYFLAQIPAGLLLDRFGVRRVYAGSLLGWSLATLLHAVSVGLSGLMACRLLLGLAEAPCFPANSNAVALWFPRRERARAIGVYTAAEYIALGFLSPLLFWLLSRYGWRTLFALSGSLGLAYGLVFWRGYRDPQQHGGLSPEERALLTGGGGAVAVGEPLAPRVGLRACLSLLRHRAMWGLCVGQFAVYSTFVFFLTWFPTYLATERHMGWIKVGLLASLPYVAGFFGILFAGTWSDALLARGHSLALARKLPVITGLLLASTIVLANWASSNALVVAILSVAFFAQAMSSSGWAVLSEIAPPGQLGQVGALFSASANLSGILTPLVIGLLVQRTGSFLYALGFVAAVALIGAAAWLFAVGDLSPLPAGARQARGDAPDLDGAGRAGQSDSPVAPP